MKLSDPEVKKHFFDFINDKKRDAGFTSQVLAEKLGWEERTVNRYISNDGRDMPNTIPEKSYYDLLTAVGSTHDEFNEYVQQNQNSDNRISIGDNAKFEGQNVFGVEGDVTFNIGNDKD